MKIKFIVKTIFDKVVTLIALIILLPLFLVVTVLIKIDSKGPVFFMQGKARKNIRAKIEIASSLRSLQRQRKRA